MPKIHPRADVVQDLVEGLGGPERKLLLHVLECGFCRSLLRERLEAAGPPAGQGEPGAAMGRVLAWRRGCDAGGAVDGVLGRFRDRLREIEREQEEAPALVQEVLRCPAERRAALLQAPRFRTWSLCDGLVRASHQEGFRAPTEAEQLARLALEQAARLDPGQCSAPLIADLQARCWAAVGNARRIAADLRGADQAFDAARERLCAGSRDRLERARLLALEASLRRAQRRFADADSLLRRAIAIYRHAGESHLMGESILARACVLKERGEPEPAIALLREADRLIDPRQDRRLELCVRHNLADWLTEAGRFLEAQAVLARSRQLYGRFRDRPTQLRRLWVEGKVAAGLGRWGEAAGRFAEVRDGFAAERLPYDAALAALDLAVAWARLGRTAEVRALAAEVLPVFRSRDLRRESLAALLVFERAAAAEGLAVLEEAVARLRRQAAGGALREASAVSIEP